jgi:hypothetical protein
MNRDLKSDIRFKLDDLQLLEACELVSRVSPSSLTSSIVSQAKRLESNFRSKLRTIEQYEVGEAQLRDSLAYIINQKKEHDLANVYRAIVNEILLENRLFLFMASSPKDYDGLQINFEYDSIKEVFESSSNPTQFSFSNPVLASTIDSFVKNINRLNPTIIHFSGHAGKKGVLFNDANNTGEIISGEIFTKLFETFQAGIELVFLNACYSAEQAKQLSKSVKYVVGMNYSITDNTAVKFSESFYSSVFNSSPIAYEKAFKQALLKIKSTEVSEAEIPEMWINGKRMYI